MVVGQPNEFLCKNRTVQFCLHLSCNAIVFYNINDISVENISIILTHQSFSSNYFNFSLEHLLYIDLKTSWARHAMTYLNKYTFLMADTLYFHVHLLYKIQAAIIQPYKVKRHWGLQFSFHLTSSQSDPRLLILWFAKPCTGPLWENVLRWKLPVDFGKQSLLWRQFQERRMTWHRPRWELP